MTKRWMSAISIMALLVCTILATVESAQAGEASGTTLMLEHTYTEIANGWSKVERWQDNNPMFVPEHYPEDGRGDQIGQRLLFFDGVKQPHSSRFLLYYAPQYQTNPIPTPVLLVHGANDNADRAWANPNEFGPNTCGASSCPNTGLMQFLVSQGYKVFAINFGHKHGDNYYAAELIHDAIQIMKNVTGESKVDVIGWSKGAFASRMYASSIRKPGGTAYAGDIRKLILIANPNKGTDLIFRHGWTFNYGIIPECGGSANAPSPHTRMMCYGVWRNHPELSIYRTTTGDFFPGQKQMLAKWANVHPLPANEQDWYTTYYGGQGFFTAGDGIDAAMQQGSLVDAILGAGIPASISTYLLSGNQNDIPNMHNEHTGPSDGVVFVQSAAAVQGIGRVTGNVTLPLNHLELAWASQARSQIDQWLKQ